MLGLPEDVTACLFDLDGVLTSTAEVHCAAWKQTFDAFLRSRDPSGFVEFSDRDYTDYVDGRRRADGVRAFLAARQITLPEGAPADPPDATTVHGIGNRKNDLLNRMIEREGVRAYSGSTRYLHAVQEAGLGIGVVTSSANGAAVLAAAGLTALVRVRVDAHTIATQGLRGKPAPDSFLAAAEALAVSPAHTAVFEDALSGVAAGRAGGFGHVVGVDRADQAAALLEHGAHVVVSDLAELLEPVR